MFYPPEGQGVEKTPFLFGSEPIKFFKNPSRRYWSENPGEFMVKSG